MPREPVKAELSDDARQLAGSLFMNGPGKTLVRFRRPHRIDPRCRAALDELVAAQIISVDDCDEHRGAIVYRAIAPTCDCVEWLFKTYGVSGPPNPIRLMQPEDTTHDRP